VTAEPLPDPDRVARTYYVIAAVYTLSASVIWGINTIFLLRVGGLTLFDVFLANAVFTGSMALFELPTGIVADTRGRRFSFLCSVTILFFGTLLYVAIPTLGGGLLAFCGASVLLGFGYTFYSGAVEAWVVDALTASGYDGPLERVLARGGIVTSAAMLAGTVAGGILADRHLVIPYLVRCSLLLIALVVALVTMREIGFTVRPLVLRELPRQMARVGKDGIRFGWNMPRARFVILAGAIPAIFLEWGYHAWQPYFLELLGMDSMWVLGLIAAAISVAMMLGNWLVERLTRFCGRRTTILLGAAAVYSVAAIGVGLATSFPVAVGLYLVGMISAGVSQPVRAAYLNLVAPTEHRATVLSLSSLIASGGSMGGQAGLGWLSSRFSLAGGYIAGGIVTIAALPVLLAIRRLGGGPDRIIGKAGRYSICPSLALPDGVAVAAEREVTATPVGPAA
jgi:MFS family permease